MCQLAVPNIDFFLCNSQNLNLIFVLDISDDAANFGSHTERMNHLRMSSQSDDTRKNKKTKKSLIETFQNLYVVNTISIFSSLISYFLKL